MTRNCVIDRVRDCTQKFSICLSLRLSFLANAAASALPPLISVAGSLLEVVAHFKPYARCCHSLRTDHRGARNRWRLGDLQLAEHHQQRRDDWVSGVPLQRRRLDSRITGSRSPGTQTPVLGSIRFSVQLSSSRLRSPVPDSPPPPHVVPLITRLH